MKLGVLLVVVWLLTGLGAVAGSIFGGAAGQTGLFAGAVAGGAVVAYLAPALCSRFGWIAADAKRSASIGALIGFLIAAPIAATNLRTPVIPVLICSLAGVGAVVGARRVAMKDEHSPRRRDVASVVTVLEAHVAPERAADLQAAYATAQAGPFPPGLLRSTLLQDSNDPTHWRIATVWQSRDALAAMRSAGKPRGVQMFEAAGAAPTLTVLEVIAELVPPKGESE